MPRTIKEHEVEPGVVVKLRQRIGGEGYATEYSVQTFEDGSVVWWHDCQGFGNTLDYMERKFQSVVENVSNLLRVGAVA